MRFFFGGSAPSVAAGSVATVGELPIEPRSSVGSDSGGGSDSADWGAVSSAGSDEPGGRNDT